MEKDRLPFKIDAIQVSKYRIADLRYHVIQFLYIPTSMTGYHLVPYQQQQFLNLFFCFIIFLDILLHQLNWINKIV